MFGFAIAVLGVMIGCELWLVRHGFVKGLWLRLRAARSGFALAWLGVLLPVQALAQGAVGPSLTGGDPVLEGLMVIVRNFGGAVKAGQWFVVVVLGVVGLVLAVRAFGKRVHDLIPDDSLWDKPFFFLFETKPGGTLLNALTATGLSITAVVGAGTHLTPELLLPLVIGTGGVVAVATAVYGWGKDVYEWWKRSRIAEANAAGAAAAAKVDSKAAAIAEDLK
jgi:hypothetical protein